SKLYEHVKYFYDVSAWLPRNAVVVNQKAFDSLDKDTQAAVLKVAASASERGWKTSEQRDGEYLKELSAKGMTVDTSNDTLKRELRIIGGRMTTEWLRTAGDDGKAIIDAYRK
ncbi:MAG TPA: C4-dicarboxylate ABC transporter substrate-binding protein, partial [Rubrivivax sp.]|nr:C4-dicarboxylate ABC transporter substrate-binding protein [Rubrivivax sp.]